MYSTNETPTQQQRTREAMVNLFVTLRCAGDLAREIVEIGGDVYQGVGEPTNEAILDVGNPHSEYWESITEECEAIFGTCKMYARCIESVMNAEAIRMLEAEYAGTEEEAKAILEGLGAEDDRKMVHILQAMD